MGFEIEEDALGSRIECFGGHLSFAFGVQAVEDGPGVERDAGFGEVAGKGFDGCGAIDGFGGGVVLRHPVGAIVGLDGEAEFVCGEDIADQLAFAVVLELPDPGEVPGGVEIDGGLRRAGLGGYGTSGERGAGAEGKRGRDGGGTSEEATA